MYFKLGKLTTTAYIKNVQQKSRMLLKTWSGPLMGWTL